MRKDPKIFLKHIQESIEKIEKHIKGMSEDEFEDDIKIQDAVIRRIEIIGEKEKIGNIAYTDTVRRNCERAD